MFIAAMRRNIMQYPTLKAMLPKTLPSRNHTAIHVKEPSPADNGLEITCKENVTHYFPYMYLRDHCACASCYHQTSQQRLNYITNLDLNIKPSKVHIQEGLLSITWTDRHVSEFDLKRLISRKLTNQSARKYKFAHEDVVLWDGKQGIPSLDFMSVLNYKRVLLDWLQALRDHGLVLMTGAPLELGQLERIGKAVGFIRPTLYGVTVPLRLNPHATNLGYTNLGLRPHSDLIYYELKPSVFILHCIEQVKTGGESIFVDGYRVAEAFREANPEAFALMTSTPVLHRATGVQPNGEGFDQSYARPIIELDMAGRIRRINFNDSHREDFPDTTPEQLPKIYEAYHELARMLSDPKFFIQHKLSPGEICAIDNDRMLHGRNGFEVNEFNSQRWLQQAYFDWDILLSKMKLLKENIR
ncbi:gamma-butyrobetaine dioxygenase isoform X2 [Nematostella vectensis]|nr:gamma-butyrobetaine dioxygenase isoform X2 [Nematostella vectensis]XP_048579373.1 gamma-butyrobetaine dioxygenase isoform X2 [Nematostella vectensis]XP_048579374.1 gamma-butyrobetaine dioxygenase isoform X2 [Nematostella vectensis]